MKPFKPNQQQLEAINNGATMLWVPLDSTKFDKGLFDVPSLIAQLSPLQLGEQYFVQEEFPDYIIVSYNMGYPVEEIIDKPANQMQEHQSRTKFTVTNVEVRQVQDVTLDDQLALMYGVPVGYLTDEVFADWYDDRYPDQPYDANPYGFLVTMLKETT